MPRAIFSHCLVFSFLGFLATAAFADATPAITGRTCVDKVTLGQPLCDPGTVDVVTRPFDLYAKARAVAVDVGSTPLPPSFTAYVFDFSGDATAGWLAPPVLTVPQRYPETRSSLGTIRFTLHNHLPPVLDNTFMINGRIPGGDQPLNIHTHGLVVLPHQADAHGAFGDYVGVLTCPPQTTPPVCPHDPNDMQMTEVCDEARLAAQGHSCGGHLTSGMASMAGMAAMHGHEILLKPIPYAIDLPGDHPASFAWFHPHAHEISSPQVGAGLSGVLTVGSLCSDPSLADAARAAYCTTRDGAAVLNDKIKTRVLMLKDFEVFSDRQGDKKGAAGAPTPSAEGYRIVPTCAGDVVVSAGFCTFPGDDTTTLDGHWLFTINGQIKPTIAMEVGRPELWRIANVSSNATYKLSLCRDAPVPDTATDPLVATCQDTKAFRIVSLDGGQTPQTPTLTDEKEILLPPGARAEIVVEPVANETFALVQKGFHQPDPYPPVVMATVSTGAGAAPAPVSVSFKPTAAKPPAPAAARFDEPADCERKPDDLGPNDWVSLKGGAETVSVFFGKISNDP